MNSESWEVDRGACDFSSIICPTTNPVPVRPTPAPQSGCSKQWSPSTQSLPHYVIGMTEFPEGLALRTVGTLCLARRQREMMDRSSVTVVRYLAL